jgi:hypothetical protein
MNWLLYLPPVISIYLILISELSNKFLKRLITDNKRLDAITKLDTATEEEIKKVIEEVALDWGERINFFNTMFVTLISSLSIYSVKGAYWAIGTFVVLLFIFIPLLLWTNSLGAGNLATHKTRHFNLLYASVCHIALILVNVILMVEIFIIKPE